MKATLLVSMGLGAFSLSALGQTPDPTPPPTFEEAVNAFAIKPPDEGSPFFADRELARLERRKAANRELTGGLGPNETAIYPKVRDSENSATRTFTGFFTNMFSSIRPFQKTPETRSRLELEPTEFSLSERREVQVTYSVRNNTKKMMRLDFPTTQRVEILTYNENMQVVERWSDDRAFEEEEGIIFINPDERISYTEPLPTREMKPGELQTVGAELIGYPDFSAGKQITPSP